MNELALFAEAGGGILGGYLLGWKTVCAVEITDYPRRVLLARQRDGILPRFPIWDDITTFDGRPWCGRVDVVSGGFPCQGYSTAARGRNCATNMWPEMLRVIGDVRPRFVFCENVLEDPIHEAQADLADSGYTTIRGRFDASQLGADHTRRRWWCIGDAYGYRELGQSEYAKMGELPTYGSTLWEENPDLTRVVNGMAYRMDRFEAVGNGQVPAVVRFAWDVFRIQAKKKDSTPLKKTMKPLTSV